MQSEKPFEASFSAVLQAYCTDVTNVNLFSGQELAIQRGVKAGLSALELQQVGPPAINQFGNLPPLLSKAVVRAYGGELFPFLKELCEAPEKLSLRLFRSNVEGKIEREDCCRILLSIPTPSASCEHQRSRALTSLLDKIFSKKRHITQKSFMELPEASDLRLALPNYIWSQLQLERRLFFYHGSWVLGPSRPPPTKTFSLVFERSSHSSAGSQNLNDMETQEHIELLYDKEGEMRRELDDKVRPFYYRLIDDHLYSKLDH